MSTLFDHPLYIVKVIKIDVRIILFSIRHHNRPIHRGANKYSMKDKIFCFLKILEYGGARSDTQTIGNFMTYLSFYWSII